MVRVAGKRGDGQAIVSERALASPRSRRVVWLEFSDHATRDTVGHEQAGRRPALVLSPKAYNGRAGLAIVCPIASHVKGYPFEVLLPPGLPIKGAIQSDQVRTIDWHARNARYLCAVPVLVTDAVRQRLLTLT